MVQLFVILNRGGDATTVARAAGVTSVQQKFMRMQAKLKAEAGE